MKVVVKKSFLKFSGGKYQSAISCRLSAICHLPLAIAHRLSVIGNLKFEISRPACAPTSNPLLIIRRRLEERAEFFLIDALVVSLLGRDAFHAQMFEDRVVERLVPEGLPDS